MELAENLSKDVKDITEKVIVGNNNTTAKSINLAQSTQERVIDISGQIIEYSKLSQEELRERYVDSLKVIEKKDSQLFSLIQKLYEAREIEQESKMEFFLTLLEEKNRALIVERLRDEIDVIREEFFEIAKDDAFFSGQIKELKREYESLNKEFRGQVNLIKSHLQEGNSKRAQIEKDRLQDIKIKIKDKEFDLLRLERKRLINREKLNSAKERMQTKDSQIKVEIENYLSSLPRNRGYEDPNSYPELEDKSEEIIIEVKEEEKIEIQK